MLIEVVLDDNKIIKQKIPDIIRGRFQTSDKRLMDLKTIAEGMFSLECLIHDNKSVTKIKIPTYVSKSEHLSNILGNLYTFLFSKSIDIEFVKNPQSLFSSKNNDFKDDFTCLFSGGMDSVSGILASEAKFGTRVKGCFTDHPDFRIKKRINQLQKSCLSPKNISVVTVGSQNHGTQTQKTRGFLYILNAALLGSKNIIVPECGVTMYQPQFTLLDNITMTTHPEVLQYSKAVLEEVLKEKISIMTPNEDLTKAEIAASCPNKEALLKSCSCQTTTRFYGFGKPHCGSCYACVVRRIGMIVAGFDDKSTYRNDILLKRDAPSDQIDNVTALAEFSLQYIRDPQNLKWQTSRIIEMYGKEDLFRRLSEDFLSALYLLRKEGKLSNNFLDTQLDEGISLISKETIQNRIDEVRNLKHKPVFSIVL